MTLPASGAISTAQIRTELGGSGPVVIPSTEVRELVKKPTGSIVLPNDFWGKSAAALSASASPVDVNGDGGGLAPITVTTNSTTVTPSNGTAPYTYSWSRISGDSRVFAVSPTAATTAFRYTNAPVWTVAIATFRCTVTDALGATAAADVIATCSNIG